MSKRIKQIALFVALTLIISTEPAFAAGAGMPWEGPLDQIIKSLSGPVARAIGVASIIVTGLSRPPFFEQLVWI